MISSRDPGDPPPRRLLLVRHGLPDYRGKHPGDLWPGPPLSLTGYRQAAQAAAAVVPLCPLSISTSPLTRCVETARVVGRACGLAPRIDSDLREWHRSESLHEVTVRLTRWLVRWLRGNESCGVAVSHASPLLAILRSALYIPQVQWHKPGRPDALEVSSIDRFEVSMASVFEITFQRDVVRGRRCLHPRPRVQHASKGRLLTRLPRPLTGSGEGLELRRRNALAIIGAVTPRAE